MPVSKTAPPKPGGDRQATGSETQAMRGANAEETHSSQSEDVAELAESSSSHENLIKSTQPTSKSAPSQKAICSRSTAKPKSKAMPREQAKPKATSKRAELPQSKKRRKDCDKKPSTVGEAIPVSKRKVSELSHSQEKREAPPPSQSDDKAAMNQVPLPIAAPPPSRADKSKFPAEARREKFLAGQASEVGPAGQKHQPWQELTLVSTFVDSAGDEVPQIPWDEAETNARGVALISMPMIDRFDGVSSEATKVAASKA